MFKFLFGMLVGIFMIMFIFSILFLFWHKTICNKPLNEEVSDLETVEEDEENVKVFTSIKEFMRFVNNYDGELIIKNNVVFDKNKNKVAKFKKEVVE